MNRTKISILATLLVAILASSCSHLHHVQVSEMDLTQGSGQKFDLRISNMGLNLSDAAGITKAIAGKNSGFGKGAQAADDAWKAITYGPRTGEVTFSDDYADELYAQISAACPLDKLIGVTTIRETNKYPVISGEIVSLTGYCRKN